MGRYPCCNYDDGDLKKGPWTKDEDEKLIEYIYKNGQNNWRLVPKNAGLKRCGKSCRLRWNNYLKPGIKRGGFTNEEEQIIINLHSSFGNKWSRIATHLPGRTDNEIKNFYNTYLGKKLLKLGIDPKTHKPISHINSLIFTSTLRLQAQVTLQAKIQQFLQSRPNSSINTNLFSSMQENFLSNPIQGAIYQFLNSPQPNFTITTPCLDNTTNSLPNGYSSISNSLEVPSEKINKIEAIQKKSALSLCEEDTHKPRNDPNSLEFCPNKLNSSANQNEGLIAWSSRIDGIECSLPNDYPSISSSSKVHSKTFNKIETIQSRSAWLMCNDEKHKSRNGPNSLEFCQANELNSSANQVEGLNIAWSSRIDSIECSLPNDYPSISNSSKVHPETFDKIETIQSRSAWLLCNANKHKTRNYPNSSKGIQANELNSNHVEGLVPSTSKSSNLNKNCIPKFSELDDIDAWEIPQDDEAISFFWNTIFQ